ncbi:hypothetical protein BDW74DRAFT_175996 [Aspergillus multicolor]|uniref:uncharacterized protein n=1 Tax=Aspergillus multicolor TaxID=41759 RepID=UPI003CCE0F2D
MHLFSLTTTTLLLFAILGALASPGTASIYSRSVQNLPVVNADDTSSSWRDAKPQRMDTRPTAPNAHSKPVDFNFVDEQQDARVGTGNAAHREFIPGSWHDVNAGV